MTELTKQVTTIQLVKSSTSVQLIKNITTVVLTKQSGTTNATFYTGLTTITFNGSQMTGTDGDSGRKYTHSGTIASNAKLYLGSTAGGLMRVDSSNWILDTVTSTNDRITVNVPVYDTDRLNLDT